MCGRYALFNTEEFLEDVKDINSYLYLQQDLKFFPSYNIAPSSLVPTLLHEKQSLKFTQSRWGLLPSWSKELKNPQINARSESVHEKPYFQDSFLHRRCLIPANGYFEWYKKGNNAVPFYISPCEGSYFAFAGIYDVIENNASSAILTTQANETLHLIHPRMPVILEKKDWHIWLNPLSTLEELMRLFTSYDANETDIYEVSTYVNSVKNNSRKCLEPIETLF